MFLVSTCIHIFNAFNNLLFYISLINGYAVSYYLIFLFFANPKQFIKDTYSNIVEGIVILFDFFVECNMAYNEYIEPKLKRVFTLFDSNEYDLNNRSICYDSNGDLVNIDYVYAFDKISIDGKEYFVSDRIEEVIPFKKQPFIQVELKYNGVDYDINEHIKKFYVRGSVFDSIFFKAFMKYFYNVNIDSTNYTIQIITNDCNIKTLGPEDILYMKKYNEIQYDKDNVDLVDHS
jgi:hypothetical protein